MEDPTEPMRRAGVAQIHMAIESQDPAAERKRLEVAYGQVWNTEELSRDFEVLSFFAPFCTVKRKADGKSGTLLFQHQPRFYFQFVED